jgi:hypothetical protein
MGECVGSLFLFSLPEGHHSFIHSAVDIFKYLFIPSKTAASMDARWNQRDFYPHTP